MIDEDFVSFEIAKLLKEKGFECEKDSITAMYNEIGKFHPLSTAVDEYYYDYNDFDEYDYVAPTLQMAMKWLRNKHDIVCSVGLFTDLPETPPYWSFNILNQSKANVMYEAFDIKCETYEEASEAAIKYCLENLI